MAGSPLNQKYQTLFQEFNQGYFQGALPRYRSEVVDRITWRNESGRTYRRRRLIRLLESEEKTMVFTLLHEMAHAATNDHHAARFQEEMKRLNSFRAPLDPSALSGPIQPKRLIKSLFKSFIHATLVDDQSITLWQWSKWLVRYGSVDTPPLFLESTRGYVEPSAK